MIFRKNCVRIFRKTYCMLAAKEEKERRERSERSKIQRIIEGQSECQRR